MLMKLVIECKDLLTILINYLNDIDMISKEMFINFDLFRFFNIIKFLSFHFIALINYLIIRGFVRIMFIRFFLLISYIIISRWIVFLLIRWLLNSLASIFSSAIIAISGLKEIIFSIIAILIRDSSSSCNHQWLFWGW